jgi:glycosyltransferase involved in cell wall biosynthesis
MHIVIVTDAWTPQVNGVVRTLQTVGAQLRALGHEVDYITPDLFRTVQTPTYPEIRLAVFPGRKLRQLIDAAQPCAIHIATEGPLGFAARAYCRRRGYSFTTAVHTRFPEYIHARSRIPLALTYAVMRWFHRDATRVMVATESMRRELEAWGFRNIVAWTRGVDTVLFQPRGDKDALLNLPRPVWLYVGRVAVEKNIAAFLNLDLPGTKLVVGDGPQFNELKRKHPNVHFAGARFGEDLARHYAASDVFVFPSRTDTFGLVLLEALASGVPVAAYPVTGPKDVVGGTDVAVLDDDLGRAARAALSIPPERCRAFALGYSWRASAEQFARNLMPFRDRAPAAQPQAAE